MQSVCAVTSTVRKQFIKASPLLCQCQASQGLLLPKESLKWEQSLRSGILPSHLDVSASRSQGREKQCESEHSDTGQQQLEFLHLQSACLGTGVQEECSSPWKHHTAHGPNTEVPLGTCALQWCYCWQGALVPGVPEG